VHCRKLNITNMPMSCVRAALIEIKYLRRYTTNRNNVLTLSTFTFAPKAGSAGLLYARKQTFFNAVIISALSQWQSFGRASRYFTVELELISALYLRYSFAILQTSAYMRVIADKALGVSG
jgi:hypothetical protein